MNLYGILIELIKSFKLIIFLFTSSFGLLWYFNRSIWSIFHLVDTPVSPLIHRQYTHRHRHRYSQIIVQPAAPSSTHPITNANRLINNQQAATVNSQKNTQPVAYGSKTIVKLIKPASTKYTDMEKNILWTWFTKNQEYPYPNYFEKTKLSEETSLTKKQISQWFTNQRRKKLTI